MNDLVKNFMAWGSLRWPWVAWSDFTIREPAKNHPGFGGWLDCWLGCPGLAWACYWAGWLIILGWLGLAGLARLANWNLMIW